MKLARFTLRDLFWLVLVCALGLGWWLDHSRNSHWRALLISAQTELTAAQAENQKLRSVLESTDSAFTRQGVEMGSLRAKLDEMRRLLFFYRWEDLKRPDDEI